VPLIFGSPARAWPELARRKPKTPIDARRANLSPHLADLSAHRQADKQAMCIRLLRARVPAVGMAVVALTLVLSPAMRSWAAPSPSQPGGSVVSLNDATVGSNVGQFQYSGAWQSSTGSGKYLGDDHYTSRTGDRFTVALDGVGIRLYGSTASHHGIADVTVDSMASVSVDFYSASRQDQAILWSSPVLTAGRHTVTVSDSGRRNANSTGSVITADRLDVITAPIDQPSGVTVNDGTVGGAINQFSYGGAWRGSTGDPGEYLGDDHYSDSVGSSYRLQYYGTQARIFGAVAPWHGVATASVDNQSATPFDQYAPSRRDQVLLWTTPVLPLGIHTIVVQVTGTHSSASAGNVVTVDRADILTSQPTATPPPAPSPSPSPAPTGALTRCGTGLCLDGIPYRFTGVNAYELATQWGSNVGCGQQVDDLDGFFTSLRPHTLTRVAAEQQQAYNPTTHALDFSALDRVVQAAQRHGQKLILTLGNEWAGCDEGIRKDQAWYDGGYRTVRNDRGVTPLSYLDYMNRIVSHYKDSPAIGMWELVNEPEAPMCASGFVGDACAGQFTCPSDAATSLRDFFDVAGASLKRIDPMHLLISGTIGDAWQCGTTGADYATVHASTYIDIGSYHDYGSDNAPMPGDSVNGLATRLHQMLRLGKPLVVEEAGILAATAGNCVNPDVRSDQMSAKLDAFFSAGGTGYLAWNWAPTAPSSCDHTITSSDPLYVLLRDYPL
jgi:mannan endo-1,4-beta-mannosidase